MLDEPNLCTLLLTRLTDETRSFSLRLYLDRVQFHKGTCYFQLARVTRLQKEGAQVYLCDGVGRSGSWHKKAAVFDRRWLLTGGANFTLAARHNNEELVYKLAGPGVERVLEAFQNARARFALWTP